MPSFYEKVEKQIQAKYIKKRQKLLHELNTEEAEEIKKEFDKHTLKFKNELAVKNWCKQKGYPFERIDEKRVIFYYGGRFVCRTWDDFLRFEKDLLTGD